ncbi:MAG: SAM-dependent methyltransferase [Pseudomonadota bacterium]
MPDETPLTPILHRTIAEQGPLPIAEYMMLCLTHPQHGYYTTGSPVGGRASAEREGGDFITAPEISQMFGEMIGVWCMEVWQALGEPAAFSLVEIGPGRGTLMRDLLRVADALPGFKKAAQVHLVEVSPTLAEQQSLLLTPTNTSLRWIGDIDALPDQPAIIIANELLDALPFRQWVKQGEAWHERAVGLGEGKLTFVTRPNTLRLASLPAGHENEPEGMIFETSPAREGFIARLAHWLNAHNGAALFLDYGHLKTGFGDTFQAVRDHAHVDVLSSPGRCDLTSHVDFAPLTTIAREAGCAVPPPVTQGDFLLDLGLLERAGNLGSGREAHIQEALRSAVERLAGPQHMGTLFKAIAFGAPASLGERWPGFTPKG